MGIAAVGLAIGAVGTIVQVMGQMQQAKAAREEATQASQQAIDQAAFQANEAEQSAAIERENALLSRENLLQDIQRRREEGEERKGFQLARFGAAGALPTVESLAETGLQTELDIVNMQKAGDIELDNYLRRAQRLEDEAGFIRTTGTAKASAIQRQAKAEGESSKLATVGTILSGASGLTSKITAQKRLKK